MSAVPLGPSPVKNPGSEYGPETVSITVLNTQFGDALKHADTLDKVLPEVDGSVGRLALVGFSEVTPGVRDSAVRAIEERGYKAVIPEGEGTNVDTVWAVSPGLEVDPSSTVTHVFPDRVASRPGKRQKRDAGRQAIVVTTPQGHVLRAGTERLAPPIRGGKARIRQIGHMARLLDENSPPDPRVDLDFEGGDHNHADGPTDLDKQLYGTRGFKRVLDAAVPTYNLGAASRTVRAAGVVARVLGRYPSMRFDEAYLRPGPGRSLVDLGDARETELTSGQIGYISEALPVEGTDHHAVRTTVTLQPKK